MESTIGIFPALVAAALLLAACSSGAPSTIQGFITDDAGAGSKAACGPANALQVDLTNASGTVIARDNSAAKDWTGRACAIPFSFTNVPSLATYGITIQGLGGGTVWLTPSQASQTVSLHVNPDFTLSRG
jgi:predicted small secreted protein